MDLGVRAQESSLHGMFAAGERLSMPPYQRSYSWGEREALELLNDLKEACDSGLPHFIGAVVVVQDDDTANLEIVDGQQRLTTLTILLAVLRDMEADKDRADALHTMIADEARPRLGEGKNWRLTLNHMDGPFFRAAIQERGATRTLDREATESDSQQRLLINATAIQKELSQMSEDARRKLVQTVTEACAIVRVMVKDRDQGFKVFRVLNTRGKEPNNHDIIKTELFEKAKFSVREAELYAEKWAEHEATLGGGAFDDLLRQIRAIHDKSAKGDMVAGFRRVVIQKMKPRIFLDATLPRYVEAYKRITDGDAGNAANADVLSAYLNRLRTLEHLNWRAPAIKYIVECGLDTATAPQFFAGLERLGFMMQLIIHDRDQRNKRYRKVSDAIGNDRALFSRSGPLSISRDESRRIRERLLGRFATFGQRRAMALRLNAALEGGETIPPEADATVEHVLPRNVPEDSHWMTIWPDPAKRRELTDTLGNLVLLTHKINQKADRMDYRAKKDVYFNGAGGTDFALTRDLREQDAWTADVVRTRTQRLADILATAWDLP